MEPGVHFSFPVLAGDFLSAVQAPLVIVPASEPVSVPASLPASASVPTLPSVPSASVPELVAAATVSGADAVGGSAEESDHMEIDEFCRIPHKLCSGVPELCAEH